VTTPPDVTIVGGGVSGLAAAVRLAGAGLGVAVLEARGVLGGRATSFRDPRSGETFDNGQHALMGCYRETFGFLSTIGARDTVDVQPSLRLAMVDAAGRALSLQCPSWPPPLHLAAGVLRWRELPLRDRGDVLRIAPALMAARRAVTRGGPMPCHPGETVAQWLARHGQHGRLVELLWEPLALAALNQPIDVAAASTFVRVLGRVFGGRATDASLALANRPLVEVFGVPAARRLAALGAEVVLHALARVVIAGGRVAGIEVRGEARPATRVVLATPWHTWPRVIAGDTAPMAGVIDAARRTAPSPIVTISLSFDRPVIDQPVVGFPGQWVQWAFDTSHLCGAGASGARGGTSSVALVVSGAGDALRMDEQDLVARARTVLDRASPDAGRATLVGRRIVREPRATFSLAPGQPRRPATRTAVGGLYLASDWVDTGLPATIEGAIEAGHRAADAVLADV
jgi:zeta-carotene desaturase